jgi:hypothetical protein
VGAIPPFPQAPSWRIVGQLSFNITRYLAIYVGHLVLLRFSSVGGNDGLAMQLLRDTTIHTNFWRGNLLENVHL